MFIKLNYSVQLSVIFLCFVILYWFLLLLLYEALLLYTSCIILFWFLQFLYIFCNFYIGATLISFSLFWRVYFSWLFCSLICVYGYSICPLLPISFSYACDNRLFMHICYSYCYACRLEESFKRLPVLLFFLFVIFVLSKYSNLYCRFFYPSWFSFFYSVYILLLEKFVSL